MRELVSLALELVKMLPSVEEEINKVKVIEQALYKSYILGKNGEIPFKMFKLYPKLTETKENEAILRNYKA